MSMKAPKVGQVIYSLNVGNTTRHREQKLTPVTVTKVGRKYFYIEEDWRSAKFYIRDWREFTEYVSRHRLYESPKEWEDEKEITDICREIAKAFEYGGNRKGLSLLALRSIKRFIDNTGNDELNPAPTRE